jgi:hypothetical protein
MAFIFINKLITKPFLSYKPNLFKSIRSFNATINPPFFFPSISSARFFSSQDESLNQLADQFAMSRLDIEDAAESLNSTYFDDDIESAKESVASVLNLYEKILSSAGEQHRNKIKQSWGLRIEQLKQELNTVIVKSSEEH